MVCQSTTDPNSTVQPGLDPEAIIIKGIDRCVGPLYGLQCVRHPKVSMPA